MLDVTALFHMHHEEITRYLVGLTGDADLAADAAQEAFVRLNEKPPASQAQIRSWLYRVATNFAFDTMRVATRRAEIVAERGGDFPMSQDPVPDAQLEQMERREAVRGALKLLRPKERAILLMRAQGFSYKEIAATLDVPMNSIGAVGARGLRKLSAKLSPREAQL